MKRFTILKDNFENFPAVLGVFKDLVGSRVEAENKNGYWVLTYEYENAEDIKNLFLSLGNELMVDILAYNSFFEGPKQKEEQGIALAMLEKLSAGIYSFKEALLQTCGSVDAKTVLPFILDSSGIDESFIRSFVAGDLNVSRASKAMFIHRNTLNYKLDKLKELSGFDLRCFTDAYILYSLILRK